MATGFDYRTILFLGFFEASLSAIASPMTEHVFAQWVRCIAFAVCLGLAAMVKLMVVLSRRAGAPLDPEVATITQGPSAPALQSVQGGSAA